MPSGHNDIIGVIVAPDLTQRFFKSLADSFICSLGDRVLNQLLPVIDDRHMHAQQFAYSNNSHGDMAGPADHQLRVTAKILGVNHVSVYLDQAALRYRKQLALMGLHKTHKAACITCPHQFTSAEQCLLTGVFTVNDCDEQGCFILICLIDRLVKCLRRPVLYFFHLKPSCLSVLRY